MEIYRNTYPARVRLATPLVPGAGDGAVAKKNGEVIWTAALTDFTRVEGSEYLELSLPVNLVLTNQSFEIVWTFVVSGQTYGYVTEVDIVSPILPISEIMSLTGKDRAESESLERKVRKIIERITNRRFYPYEATVLVTSNGSNSLVLPDRILALYDLGFNGYSYHLNDLHIIDNALVVAPDKYLTIKSDYDGYPGQYQDVIWNPTRFYAFSPRLTYAVTGLWGYSTTPAAVEEAARILVKDYGCVDDIYRQRGITSVRGSEWSIEYGSQAFSGTGNVDADRLLDEFKQESMFIV